MRQALSFLLFFILFGAANVDAQTRPVPSSPVIGSKSYLVIDATTGAMLAELDPDLRLPPASLTKLMTT